MENPIVKRPLEESARTHDARLAPPPLLHLLNGNPRTPTASCRVRQVGERTVGLFHFRESSENISPRRWRKTGADTPGVFEISAIPANIVPDEDRIETRTAGHVSTNDEILPAVHAQVYPGTGTLSRLIEAVTALWDYTLQSLLSHHSHHHASR